MRGLKKSRILKLHSFSSNNTFLARVCTLRATQKNRTENTCKTFYSCTRACSIFPTEKIPSIANLSLPNRSHLTCITRNRRKGTLQCHSYVYRKCERMFQKICFYFTFTWKYALTVFLWNFSQKYVPFGSKLVATYRELRNISRINTRAKENQTPWQK